MCMLSIIIIIIIIISKRKYIEKKKNLPEIFFRGLFYLTQFD